MFSLGVVGVAIATLVAMSYRTIYLVLYLRKNIIKRKAVLFVKHILVDALIIGVSIFVSSFFEFTGKTYAAWLLFALKIIPFVFAVVILVNLIFYIKFFKNSFLKFAKKARNVHDKKQNLGDKNESI